MFEAAFPIDLRANLNVVLNSIPNKTFNDVHFITSDSAIFYMLDDFTIEIPYRMYLVDVEEDTYNVLNDIQKQILCCIYTRSCNGYIREKYLRKLLEMPFNQWAIPFIVKLCDEYILEIIEMIYGKLKERDNTDIQDFCEKNKFTIRKSYSRMISYWNEYYRELEQDFNKYIGRSLFRECLGYNRSFER